MIPFQIFTDMANSRSAQSQISLFGNLSETASNAMKLHFAMATGPVGGNGGPSTTETFDPVVLHRGLPAPPPPPTDGGNQFSGPPLPPQGPTPASSFIVEVEPFLFMLNHSKCPFLVLRCFACL